MIVDTIYVQGVVGTLSLANSVLNWILTDQVLVSVTMETANLGGHFGGGKKSGELKRYRYD